MSLKFLFWGLVWIIHKLSKVQTGATVLKNKMLVDQSNFFRNKQDSAIALNIYSTSVLKVFRLIIAEELFTEQHKT